MENLKNFLVQNIEAANIIVKDGVGSYKNDGSNIIDYTFKINNLRYRSQPFENKAEVLILGCSHSEGNGLPDGLRWQDFLSNKMNKEFSSLAYSGDSMIGQIIKCFYYFKNFGHPKQIIALFPMSRIAYPKVNDKLSSNGVAIVYNTKPTFHGKNQILTVDLGHEDTLKYAKSPYDLSEVLPKEFAFFYERSMLDMLEQYCETNNIDFIWSVWTPVYQEKIFKSIEDAYPGYHKNYCWISTHGWTNNKGFNVPPEENELLHCHRGERSHILFDDAADRIGRNPHWGFHRHMHIADEIYDYITKNT
jgi:hypothetical protein